MVCYYRIIDDVELFTTPDSRLSEAVNDLRLYSTAGSSLVALCSSTKTIVMASTSLSSWQIMTGNNQAYGSKEIR